MSKSHRYRGYVINRDGRKPEPTRTAAEKKALRDKNAMRNKIDDMEFEKSLGILGDLK